jgi:membrane protein YdbS with pleckstrin-like domain
MLEKIFAPVLKFFGIIASSLTGISAVFTAVGFLAERSHLYMLGFTAVPVDLNQYLYTGARFFAYLPITLLSAIGLGVLDVARRYFLFFSAFVLAVLMLNLIFRIPFLKKFKVWLIELLKAFVRSHRSGILFVILILQFAGIFLLILTTQVTNLLFEQPTQPAAATYLPVNAEILSSWIVNKRSNELFEYMGLLFLIALLTIAMIWQVTATYRRKEASRPGFWPTIWLGINLMLLGTQLILLPINYGILLLPNSYPAVSVTFKMRAEPTTGETSGLPAWPQDERLVLLHQQGNRFYFYSQRAKKIWLVRSDEVRSVVYHGMNDLFAK